MYFFVVGWGIIKLSHKGGLSMDKLAHLNEGQLDVIRKLEDALDVTLVAYERGYVPSLDDSTGNSHL